MNFLSQDHLGRLKHWVLMGLALLIFGLILHFTHGENGRVRLSKTYFCLSIHSNILFFSGAIVAIPLNKQLYTLSYVCLTAGAAALVFSAIYALV